MLAGPYPTIETAVFADADGDLEVDADNVLDLDAHGDVIDAAARFGRTPDPEPEGAAAAKAVAA